MKKCLFVLLALTLVLTACGCAFAQGAYVPGTYTASEPGFGGLIEVSVTVDENAIVEVLVKGDAETQGIGGNAVEQLPAQILEAQSAEVDGVSGATVSSTAIRTAAAKAIEAAKGAETATSPLKMAPGTYTAYGRGFSVAEMLPVYVTVSETAIEKIEVEPDNAETKPILKTVTDLFIPRMIENQSVVIDAVTGATMSSSAVREAVTAAVTEALIAGGSDPEAIEAFYNVPEKTGGEETIDTDVLVVGMGGAGCAAAMRVAELQSEAGEVNVLAIDKAAKYGGTSSITTQSFAVNPPRMIADKNNGENYVDVNWLNDMHKEKVGDNPEADVFWAMMRDYSGIVADWQIYDHGFTYSEPKELWGAPRVVIDYAGRTGETKEEIASYFDKMMGDYVALGGKYMLETEGYDLIYDEANEKVVGVKAHDMWTGKEYTINAKAVIMATCGFGGSPELEKKLLEGKQNGVWKLIGMAQNDGKMWEAALKLGAGLKDMDVCIGRNVHNAATPTLLHHYPVNFIDGEIDKWTGRTAAWSLNDVPVIMMTNMDYMFVGSDGRRYANEDQMWPWWQAGPYYYGIFSDSQIKALAENGFDHTHSGLFLTSGYGYFPLNTPIPEIYDILDLSVEAGNAVKGDTLADIAGQLGMEPSVLEESVAKYNGYCETGVDEEFGKASQYLKKIGEGPYYAITAQAYTYATDGTITITPKFEVLTTDQKVIKGLYAIGTEVGGYNSTPVGGGSAQGWAYVSGYLSASEVLSYINR